MDNQLEHHVSVFMNLWNRSKQIYFMRHNQKFDLDISENDFNALSDYFIDFDDYESIDYLVLNDCQKYLPLFGIIQNRLLDYFEIPILPNMDEPFIDESGEITHNLKIDAFNFYVGFFVSKLDALLFNEPKKVSAALNSNKDFKNRYVVDLFDKLHSNNDEFSSNITTKTSEIIIELYKLGHKPSAIFCCLKEHGQVDFSERNFILELNRLLDLEIDESKRLSKIKLTKKIVEDYQKLQNDYK